MMDEDSRILVFFVKIGIWVIPPRFYTQFLDLNRVIFFQFLVKKRSVRIFSYIFLKHFFKNMIF